MEDVASFHLRNSQALYPQGHLPWEQYAEKHSMMFCPKSESSIALQPRASTIKGGSDQMECSGGMAFSFSRILQKG